MRVKGFCPICAHADPAVGTDGFLHCTNPGCPDMHAVGQLLMDDELGHIVRFDEAGGFNVKHPLRERLEDQRGSAALLDCAIHFVVTEAVNDFLIVPQGTYRLTGHPAVLHHTNQDADWEWESIDPTEDKQKSNSFPRTPSPE